jgi:bacterioferritin
LNDILKESLHHEQSQIKNLYNLLKLTEGKSVFLEEYAREMISEEELHVSEVNKMLRTQPK